MSGKPNSAQVEELRRALQIQNDSVHKIAQIKARLEGLNAELEVENRRWRESQTKVWELLILMNCASSSNAGWQARFENLLRLLAERT